MAAHPGAAAPGPPRAVRVAVGVANAALVLAVIWLASGGGRALLQPWPRAAAMALILVYQAISIAVSGVFSRGIRHEPEPFWFHLASQLVGVFALIGMPVFDVRDWATFPASNAVRASGVAAGVVGLVLRVGPMVELGRRFTHFVALQEEHRLHTRGFYARVRHPGYAGVLLLNLGLAVAFRSIPGLAIMPLWLLLILRRIDVEEAFLTRQFGDEYRAYVRRTARLVPGVW